MIVPGSSSGAGLDGLHPYTINYINAMTVKPTGSRALLMDRLVRSLVDNGVWSYLSSLPLLKSHDSQAARVDLINPSNVYTVVGTPTFTTDGGYSGMSTSNYLDSNKNISTDTLYTQNDAHLGVWCATDVSQNASDVGAIGSFTAYIRAREPSFAAVFCSVNNTGTTHIRAPFAGNGWTATSIGHSVAQRYASSTAWNTDATVFKDGVKATTGTITGGSTTPASVNFAIGRAETAGTKTIFTGHFGKAMPDATVTALYNALNTYFSSF